MMYEKRKRTKLTSIILICSFLSTLLCGCSPSVETQDESKPTNTEISYGFLDYNLFTEYWTNGIFKCGSDFEPGEYYIMSLYMANALYGVSNSPNDFSWSDYQMMRNINVNKGQYVNIPNGAILVSANEIDENTWSKYGVFLVGKDLLEGDYKIVSISDEYHTDLDYIQGINGAYQICNKSPKSNPETSTPLFENQSYISLKNGQYIIINNAKLTLDGAEESLIQTNIETNATKEAYISATTLTKSELSGSKGEWKFKNIKLLSEDCEWIDSAINKNSTVNQGAIYRKIAKLLEGFEAKLCKYTDFSELLLGFTPNTRDEFVPYAENAKAFICTGKPLKAIMTAFEKLDCVSGTFDYDKNSMGVYDFTISDLTECAKQLKISEEMLGYILAELDEYSPNIEFEDNKCHIQYTSLESKIEPISENDFIAEFPNENATINILDKLKAEYGNQSYYYGYYDSSADPSKEGVIVTQRGIHIGDDKNDVLEKYGDETVNTFVLQSNSIYQELLANDAAIAGIMRSQCSTYVTYSYNGVGAIEFYFDENESVSWVVFYLN